MAPLANRSRASVACKNDWPALGLEADWEFVASNEATNANTEIGVMILDSLSDSDSETPSTWAARLAMSSKHQMQESGEDPRRLAQDKLLAGEPIIAGVSDQSDQSTENEYFPDSKQLACSMHDRQAKNGGHHTVRARATRCKAKSSQVTLQSGGNVFPVEATAVGLALRQASVEVVIKATGGSRTLVKSKEGREALLAGAKMYEVKVPLSEDSTQDEQLVYRVVEQSEGVTSKKVRHPRCLAAAGFTISWRQRKEAEHAKRGIQKTEQSKKVLQAEDVKEGRELCGF
eukprot:TRINITY_DN75621_c0_g1_i1.p1 TRINITY_DN75621_c0_g1~~TRINITY_DN75621_c0_g1_i1.p1  ORF type:complete len:322 (+),score=55.27 TRINITY_DN75621_c0_g1_i1:104-967(+)